MSDIDSRCYGQEPAASQLRQFRYEIERLQGACQSYEQQANRDALELERLHNKLNQDSQNFQIECHKAEIELLRRDLAEAESFRIEFRNLATAHFVRIGELERELAEARGLLRTSHTDGLHWKTWRQWRERKSALLAEPQEGER
jgi:predicted RNase H-like nuclease (RuvC/YqgF family)